MILIFVMVSKSEQIISSTNTTPHAMAFNDKGLVHDVKVSKFNTLGRGQWLPDDKNYKPQNSSLPQPEAICGVNLLHTTNYPRDCRLVITWSTGAPGVCSGWIAKRRVIVTAGHCVYNAANGGWAAQIAVYCGGGLVCGNSAIMTTNARWLATTGNWYQNSKIGSTPYDMGAFLTWSDLPYSPYTFSELNCQGNVYTQISGYPGSSNGPECAVSGYDTCTQRSTEGSMGCSRDSSGWLTPDVDTCGGHSGSSVYSNEQVVGVLTGGIDDPTDHPCQNYAVAIRNSGDGASNGDGGGAWLGKLIETVEGADVPASDDRAYNLPFQRNAASS